MLKYLKFGELPSMHHTAHYVDGCLMNEYCFTRQGFDAPYSILYLHHPPTAEYERALYKEAKWGIPEKRDSTVLERRHFRSHRIPPQGNFISGRTLLAFNDDLTYGICHPASNGSDFFANNDADELFFLSHGKVFLQSLFGSLTLKTGDYLLIPRSCPYRFNFDREPRLLYVEAKKELSIPEDYLNPQGQLKMEAPYSERSFKTPQWDHALFTGDEPSSIVRKRQGIFTRMDYAENYFKMAGWDGHVYPLAINLDRIQPKTGRVHLPPISHTTFTGQGFAIMSFLPRLLDFDPQAVPCPFYHSSVNCDELLFYHSGDFTSRKTIEPGSISYHPAGIPHGPHPGAYENSIGLKQTDEQAVMVDTFSPLYLTRESFSSEDPDYPKSWQEAVHET